jgi:hypothetical protein
MYREYSEYLNAPNEIGMGWKIDGCGSHTRGWLVVCLSQPLVPTIALPNDQWWAVLLSNN